MLVTVDTAATAATVSPLDQVLAMETGPSFVVVKRAEGFRKVIASGLGMK